MRRGNWFVLSSGFKTMLIAGCLTSAGILMLLPLQSGRGLWIGTMQKNVVPGKAVDYPHVADWIAEVGDTVVIGQLIGYSTNRLQRLPLESMLNLQTQEPRVVVYHLKEIADSSGSLPERIQSWIEAHLHKASRNSQKRDAHSGPSMLIRLNETLKGVENQLAQVRRERMDQSSSAEAGPEIQRILALEKQQMDLIRLIKSEIIRSESTPVPHSAIPRWSLSAPVDSLVRLVQMELKRMEVRADLSGVLVLGNRDSRGRQRILIQPMDVPVYVLELARQDGAELSVGQEVDLLVDLEDKRIWTPGEIRLLEQGEDKIRVELKIRDDQMIQEPHQPVQAGIRTEDQAQTRLIDLLAEKTYK